MNTTHTPHTPQIMRLHTAANWGGQDGLARAARRMGVQLTIVDYPHGADSYDATYTVAIVGEKSHWGITVHNPSGAAFATWADIVRL
jgi:hypothetical protein